MRLFYCEHHVPPRHGERKIRVWRYIVHAENAVQARLKILNEKSLPEDGQDVRVRPYDEDADGSVISIGLVFREIERQPKPPAKRKRNTKLGSVQISMLQGFIRHGSWYPQCGWVWTTNLTTTKFLDRFVELGLAEKREEKRGIGSVTVYYPTDAGKAAGA